MQAIFIQEGASIDYTPVSAVSAGQVVVIGTIPLVAKLDIAAGALGALATEGVFDVAKATGALTAGDAIYWASAGNPVGGDAGTGAATGTASGNNLMGVAINDALSADTTVRVMLTAIKRTATVAGSISADDITGGDSSLNIAGIAGSGAGAGGSVPIAGGVGGATGAGGAVTVAGGAGGATSGTGGAVTIAGGAGSGGNANGGALTIRGGAKNGAGANGAIAIGDANTASVTFGVMPRIPTATVAAAGTIQGDAAAIVEGFTLVTGATNAGVKLPSAVAGMQVIIKNNVAGNMKVWPNTSDAINAITADAAFTMATLTSCLFVAYDATTWYTIPLVAS